MKTVFGWRFIRGQHINFQWLPERTTKPEYWPVYTWLGWNFWPTNRKIEKTQ